MEEKKYYLVVSKQGKKSVFFFKITLFLILNKRGPKWCNWKSNG